jgi:3-methyladenine DNA glycosylase AlkC
MNQVKREAEQRGETVTSLIEEGLRLVLAQSHQLPHRERVTLPVSKMDGGVLPGVDLNDSAALEDIMEGRG